MKAPLSITVTELGIVMLVKLQQPLKALLPIGVIELGIIVFLQPTIKVLVAVSMIALQLSRESYFGFSVSTTIFVKSLQPEYLLLVYTL